jgi:hypothetical protein
MPPSFQKLQYHFNRGYIVGAYTSLRSLDVKPSGKIHSFFLQDDVQYVVFTLSLHQAQMVWQNPRD